MLYPSRFERKAVQHNKGFNSFPHMQKPESRRKQRSRPDYVKGGFHSDGNHQMVGSKVARPQGLLCTCLSWAEGINRKQKESKLHMYMHEQRSEWVSSGCHQRPTGLIWGRNSRAETGTGSLCENIGYMGLYRAGRDRGQGDIRVGQRASVLST